jgi:2'-5' RNA ligase
VHLIAALVPPADALERAHAVATGLPPMAEHPDSDEGRHRAKSDRTKGGGLFRRREKEQPVQGPMLDVLPMDALQVTLAKFGNLTLKDVTRLADEMERRAQEWASPRLQLAGGVALEPEGDDSVWLNLGGDVDELKAVARGVVTTAQSLQLFVDRRGFRPHIQLGTITPHTTTAYLEALLAELAALPNDPWWQSTVSLLVPGDMAQGQPPFRVHREVALGGAAEH